jgi:hypothetical protein
METGLRVTLTRSVRSPRTGMLLPREGILVSITKNLGRTLLLVAFGNGQTEYLFENEVELETCHHSEQEYPDAAASVF